MKKLTIKLDELRVEAFTTGGPPAEKGTVQGHYGTTHTQDGGDTCYQMCTYTAVCTHCGQLHCY